MAVILVANEPSAIADWDQLDVHAALRKPFRASQLFSAIMGVVELQLMARSNAAAATSLQLRKEPRGPVSKTGDGEPAVHVLLVEDNPVNQKLALHILTKAGYDVDVASNGQEAVDAVQAKQSPYDAILMDCQMPVMDGYTATEQIRGLPDRRALAPIIAMTAHAMKGDRERCLEAGMNDYVAKPVNFAELRQVVVTWARVSRGQAQPTPSGGPADA